ncbi:MAG TPA: hypothetical protein PKB09_01535 [Candidatus Saccharibacteria bacterium]|nr:hypothetical protein [Candidatus Saccharibacteria bacterium]
MAKLEAFSLHRVLPQGHDAYRFVSRRSFEMQRSSANTYDRYRSFPRAVKNIARLATSSEIDAYIVREDGRNRMVGFASIIPNVTVRAADGKEYTGSDLDYLLDDRVPEIMHESVAKALIGQNTRIAQRDPSFNPIDTQHILVVNSSPSEDRSGILNRGLLDIVPPVTGITQLTPVDNRAISAEVARLGEDVILHHW